MKLNSETNPHCGNPIPHCGEPGGKCFSLVEIWLAISAWFANLFHYIWYEIFGWVIYNHSAKYETECRKIKVAFVSVYGTQCGIATYNEDLLTELKQHVDVKVFAEHRLDGEESRGQDPDWVVRCWKRTEHPKKDLINKIDEWHPDIIHFSHEYGFFSKSYLFTNLVSVLKSRGYIVVSTMHSIYEHLDKTVQEASVDHVIVHTESAKKCLVGKGIQDDNVSVVAHGSNILDGTFNEPKLLSSLWNTWGSDHTIYQPGFLFNYKGHLRMLDVVAKLKEKYPDIQYIIQGSENPNTMKEHDALYGKIINRIKELDIEGNVTVNRGFIDKNIVFDHIRTVKCVVLPYIGNPQHNVFATSGVGRMVLATSTPLIVSSVHLFDDLEGIVPRIFSDDELYKEIDKIFSNAKSKEEQISKRINFLFNTSWNVVSSQIKNVYEKLLEGKL